MALSAEPGAAADGRRLRAFVTPSAHGRRPLLSFTFGGGGLRGVFVLMRRISAYTGPDVLLGVFATRIEAEAAGVQYACIREANPAADPWKDQGYKPDMVVSRDLAVEQLPGEFPAGAVVFVVSDHSDGFGQEVRKLDSVHATPEAAAVVARVTPRCHRNSAGGPIQSIGVGACAAAGLQGSGPRSWPGRSRSPVSPRFDRVASAGRARFEQ